MSTLFSVIVGFYTLWLSSWSVALIAAVVTLAVSFGILIVVFSELPFFQRTSMIDDRLVKYKANERWLALPEDAYSQLYPEEQHKLLGRCHSDGIGLLLVGSQRHVSIVLKAVYRASSKKEGHYLDLYSRANEVKAKLTPDHR